SRFRTFVVARCRGQGLNLTADELDLIDAWFLGMGMAQRLALRGGQVRPTPAIAAPQASARTRGQEPPSERWVHDEGRDLKASLPDALSSGDQGQGQSLDDAAEEFPRVMRTRLRG